MRLQRFIALNSEFSRRKAEDLITEGRVLVNGKLVTKLGTTINPKTDKISVDGNPLKITKQKIYIMLNKPSGYICTRSDTHGRKTIFDLVPNKKLFPVGRLDKNTEGLILLTNDGDFAYKITHPKFEHKKEYLVLTKNNLTPADKAKLEKGLTIDGKKTSPATVRNIKKSNDKYSCTIIIHEGRKRQIRRMFELIKNPVIYLKRIRIEKLQLGTLKKGSYRNLTKSEIESFNIQ